jgi:hypothetical protein
MLGMDLRRKVEKAITDIATASNVKRANRRQQMFLLL